MRATVRSATVSHHRTCGFAVALAVLAAACSSTAAKQHASVTVPTTMAASTTTRASTTTTRPPLPPDRSVTLAFAGDVHFEGILRGKLAADPAAVLAPIAPILRRADIAMVNLETAITQRGTPQAKIYTFRAPPTALDALAAAGVDVANEANNHGIDFGPVGLIDTLAARAQSKRVAVIGIGQQRRRRLRTVPSNGARATNRDHRRVASDRHALHHHLERNRCATGDCIGEEHRPSARGGTRRASHERHRSSCFCIGAPKARTARPATSARSPRSWCRPAPTSSSEAIRISSKAPVISASRSSTTASATSRSIRARRAAC